MNRTPEYGGRIERSRGAALGGRHAMGFRRLLRALPMLLGALLLVAAANTSRTRFGTAPVLGPAPEFHGFVTCTPYSFVSGGESTHTFLAGGLSQPLPPNQVVAA